MSARHRIPAHVGPLTNGMGPADDDGVCPVCHVPPDEQGTSCLPSIMDDHCPACGSLPLDGAEHDCPACGVTPSEWAPASGETEACPTCGAGVP